MGQCEDTKNKILKPIMESMRMTKLSCQKKCRLVNDVCTGCNRTVHDIMRAGIDHPNSGDYK